jgi:outer membrane immunogenic protein
VLGLEIDVDGATGRDRSSALLSNTIFIFPTLTESAQSLDWLGTVRGRLGWTPVDRFLIYATGGFAFGRSAASITSVDIAAAPVLDAYVASRRSTGWTVGGGVEYALPGAWSNWSVKVEYLYYDLGRSNSTVFYQNIDFTGAPEFSTLTGTVRHNGDIVRAGLNYKFSFGASQPVVAKY